MEENWKAGDIAICVNTGYVGHKVGSTTDEYPPLKLHAEYTVANVSKCIKCNRISLDVGLCSNRAVACICGHPGINNGTYWCASIRFVKKKSDLEFEEVEHQEPNVVIS